MTPRQIAMVQHSWAQVFPIRETASQMFYDQLFELDPGLRPLFKGDIAVQSSKLFETLNAIVAQLDEDAASARIAAALGHSHARYGATAAHYRTVCAALMWTLQASVGTGFTAEVRDAWTAAYDRLAAAMLAGAETT
jgi:hemoglobin-like flavoprotein